MLVARLHVNEFAKHIVANHVENGHHIAPVADVFEQHVRRAGTKLGAEESPVIIEGDTGHDLAADGNVGLHRRNLRYRATHDRHGVKTL